MSKSNKTTPNVPTLRFKEFTDLYGWNSKNVGNILSICHGRDYKHLKDGNYPVLGTGGVITHVNEFLCNWNCVLIGRKGTINKPQYMNSPFWAVDTIFYSKPHKGQLACFQYYLFQTINWNKYNEASGVPSLSASTIEKINVKVPEYNEQVKIAEFLSKIDERIKTQNKIIEDLKTLKKELCNSYFKSIHNNTLLEYVALKNILSERKEYCSKDGTYTHGTLSKDGVFPKTERYDRDFLVKDENKQYKVTRFNNICYNPANLKFGVICRNTYGDLIFSPIYVTFEISESVYPAYIELFLTNANFIGRIRRYEQGTVYERMAVSPEDFLSYEIRMPAYEEQVKFADRIQRLQEKIEMETKFSNTLQLQRKYLLNAMFI